MTDMWFVGDANVEHVFSQFTKVLKKIFAVLFI